jgi:hypothetical protein
MNTKIRYVAPLLAAAAISGAIGLAPVAIADPGTAGAPQATSQHTVTAHPTAPPSSAPTQYGSGADPLVPSGGGADPFVPLYPGYELPG